MEEKKKGTFNKVLLIVCIIIVLIVVILFAGYAIIADQMNKGFTRTVKPDKRFSAGYTYEDFSDSMDRKEISFSSGENTLEGFIYGEYHTKGLIIFAHGIGSYHETYITLLKGLYDRGYKVFTYNATGTCGSTGESTIGLVQSALDLDAALTYAETDPELSDMPFLVLGHSWGGYAAAAVLNFDHDIKASVSLSGYCDSVSELEETLDNRFGNISKIFYPYIKLINKSVFGDNADLSAIDGINKSDVPVLIVHADNDPTISYKGASIISKSDIITNPNVEYFTFSDENRNDHGSYLYSAECAKYRKEINSNSPKTDDKNDKLSLDIAEKYWSKVNRLKYNIAAPDVIDLLDSFYERELDK